MPNPLPTADARLVRNIGERAVPIVVVEPVASVGGHVEIFATVVS
jgi:hypothetical protein